MNDIHNDEKLVKLNTFQIIWIYAKSLIRDFPRNERRPLPIILKNRKDGIYECLGLSVDGKICGYAFFVKMDNNYLLDYLAIFEGLRNIGLGSLCLSLIGKYFEDGVNIFIEVENPDFSSSPDEASLQQRRYGFYLRNNCVDTSVIVMTFGAHFKILTLKETSLSEEKVKQIYPLFYKNTLPPKRFENCVKFYSA